MWMQYPDEIDAFLVLCSRVNWFMLQTSKLNGFLTIFIAAISEGQSSNLNKKGDKSFINLYCLRKQKREMYDIEYIIVNEH